MAALLESLGPGIETEVEMTDAIQLTSTEDELELVVDGLRSPRYWDYATELDLPRHNGQVFLPEDDASCWASTTIGDGEANSIEQILMIRELAERLDPQRQSAPRR